MKRITFFLILLCAIFSSKAQIQSAYVNLDVVSENAIDRESAEAVAAGTVLCSTKDVTMKVAFDDTYARIALWGENYAINTINIGGKTFEMPMGLQGQTNAKENTLKYGGQQMGAVFQFDVKADGILYVFGKFAANKPYYVWKGDVPNMQGLPMAYKMVAAKANDGMVVGYTLPGDKDGYYVVSTGYDDGSKYLTADQCTEIYNLIDVTVENVPASRECTIWNNSYDENTRGNALGVIAFPVCAEAQRYYVNACGTKLTSNGFVFIPNAKTYASVTFGKNSGNANHPTSADSYSIFDFTSPSSLSPSIVPSEDENTGINIVNDTFTKDGVSLTFGLGSRTQNYSAREWTNTDFTNQLRIYQGATLKIMAPSDYTIEDVSFIGSSVAKITSNTGTVNNGIWTGQVKEVLFNINDINNKIDQIIVGYSLAKHKLTDGETYSLSKTYYNQDVEYTRNFTNTKWQALYIPFSMSYDDWKKNFEVAYINGIRQMDKNDDGEIDETIMDVVKIKKGSLIPNTPYLIKAKTVGSKKISVKNTTVYGAETKSTDCSTTIAKYTFTGTYNTISASTLIANNYYAMGDGSLVITDGTSDLKPFRWYMKINSRSPMYNVSNGVKAITINVVGEDEEEMTTGVQQLPISNDELPVYDLNGRRVNENNLKPGIYVKNGKKVIIK